LFLRKLRQSVEGRAGLARSFLGGALREAQEQAQDIRSLKLQSSPQRLAAYLLGLITDPNESPARIVLPFEKRRLAARVGCAEENLARAFAALRSIGVVTERSVVIARDVPALRAFASASGWRRIIPRKHAVRGGVVRGVGRPRLHD
jgi:CRP/FNR family transcriptional regulator, transcriptional activator FtrB